MIRHIDRVERSGGQRLFIGEYPTGLVYADSWQDDPVTLDFTRLGYLNYETLELTLSLWAYAPERAHLLRQMIDDAIKFVNRAGEFNRPGFPQIGARYWDAGLRPNW